MNKLYDLHLHSKFSSDSESNPEEIVLNAADMGLSGICFTDHNDFNYFSPDGKSVFDLDQESYYEYLSGLKEKNKDKLDILIGIEQGLTPGAADLIENFDKENKYDFIIGSTHVVDGIDPYYIDFWSEREPKERIRRYFENVYDSVCNISNFDVYGHLDYIVRYVPGNHTRGQIGIMLPYDLIREILKTLIEKGKGIEINTAGAWKSNIGDYNPNTSILKMYKDLGGEIITVGADSHKAGDVGRLVKEANGLLIETGFKYSTVFRNRKPEFITLES